MLATILGFLSGGIVKQFTDPLLEAQKARLQARNSHERLEADKMIEQIESARSIALAEAHDRFSATRIGRLLIVIPYGIWWSLIFFVSILNGLFSTSLTILDVPDKIHEMAAILVPAIVIGSIIERFKK